MRYKRKPKISSKPFVVLYDDREKKPWQLPYEMKKKRLVCGDYTIEGYEDVIAIEKKSGFEELFKDLASKYRPTFERFLAKLSKYPIKCIVVEDELSNLYRVWHVMKKKAPKMKMTPRTIFFWVAQIMICHGIPIIFVPKGWGHNIVKDVVEAAYEKAQEIK